jgi:hypothetical protein
MNAPQSLNDQIPVIPKPRFWRTDIRSTKIVDLGISLQERFGAEYAAAFLKQNGISIEVAIRVLSRPAERRRSGS